VRRLIVVANRLPVSVAKSPEGISLHASPGGLASGLSSLQKSYQCIMVGWPGTAKERFTGEEQAEIRTKLNAEHAVPVFLSQKQVENYYLGFSNKTIWPLFHYFPTTTTYEKRFWKSYRHVNSAFCDAVVRIAKPGDYVWVHDYQLMLLPELIRQKLPDVEIGFFLHIPFPSFELFRLLPWRSEILHGLLGADVIGFHTYDYVRHFLSSVCRIVGLEHTLGKLSVNGRIIRVDAFPMGIDYEKYSGSVNNREVQREVKRVREKVGDRKIIFSVDRLDYTKGIIERLEAFDLFLCKNAQYRGKVTMIIVANPSRTRVEDYAMLRRRLEQLVGRINGEFGMLGWMPVWYLYRTLPFEKLMALYHVADVALVTPLRDGMNLIAKEFIAAKTDGRGVLILSEMTGAASELGEALIVNSNNKAAIVDAIKEALEMPTKQQIERNRLMQKRLSRYTVSRWASEFVEALANVSGTQRELAARGLSGSVEQKLVSDYAGSGKRLFLLDYDGTLVSFASRPEQAGPDERCLSLLRKLAEAPGNEVVIISGRDRDTLGAWLGELGITLVAEHGAWVKEGGGDWECIGHFNTDWKDDVRPILELYVDRTPGSSLEEKDFSLVWHYRRAQTELASVRIQEVRDAVMSLTANLDVGVFEGSKILEVKNIGINKGRIAELWLEKQDWDFILAAGDDYTDEDMFAVLGEDAYSINVGHDVSKAKYKVGSVGEIRSLLSKLVGGKNDRPR
jgi:trehalose 6-phosphate synthase/phosphatase